VTEESGWRRIRGKKWDGPVRLASIGSQALKVVVFELAQSALDRYLELQKVKREYVPKRKNMRTVAYI
jgi:hypothetical protein